MVSVVLCGSLFIFLRKIFFDFSFFSTESDEPFSSLANKLPFETLSPILTLNSRTFPLKGDGTSTPDLSLS